MLEQLHGLRNLTRPNQVAIGKGFNNENWTLRLDKIVSCCWYSVANNPLQDLISSLQLGSADAQNSEHAWESPHHNNTKTPEENLFGQKGNLTTPFPTSIIFKERYDRLMNEVTHHLRLPCGIWRHTEAGLRQRAHSLRCRQKCTPSSLQTGPISTKHVKRFTFSHHPKHGRGNIMHSFEVKSEVGKQKRLGWKEPNPHSCLPSLFQWQRRCPDGSSRWTFVDSI